MNHEDRIRRVRALVCAAKRLADHPGELRERLQRATGLSAQGVDLALREHLETQPTEEELVALVGGAGSAPRAHVILSANVFTAGLRAIALAAATAPLVSVRCSTRENVFVPALLSHLDDTEIRQSIVECQEISPAAGEEIHLYGSDESIAEICAGLAPDVLVRAHGTGFGLALVGPGVEIEDAARALVRDMVAFDQHGCLSPRLALVCGHERALALAQAMAVSLVQAEQDVPVGALDRADIVRFRQTATVAGEWFDASLGGVALLSQPMSAWIAPPGRNMVVVACAQEDNPVAGLERHVAAIGVSGDAESCFGAVLAACPGARTSELGRMQRPRFDGPVDLRHPGVQSPRAVIERVRRGSP
ncbi:MAG: proline dehydrogenase [Deltaproteobacteria bacterium]|nr:proline dehydrogenase [Deltaproteobacteria bacterium]